MRASAWLFSIQSPYIDPRNHKTDYVSPDTPKFTNKFFLLNCTTDSKELRKVQKTLKNGKSPGLDRISNEMIKTSFENLKIYS